MKRVICGLLAIMLLAGLVAGCAAPPPPAPPVAPTPAPAPPPTPAPPAEPIELSMVGFTSPYSSVTKVFMKLIEAINERAKGELIITWKGGPEVIKAHQIGLAVQKGVIDVGWLPTVFYEGSVPIGNTLAMTEISMEEEWDRGLWDYLNDLHREQGLYAFGRSGAGFPIMIWIGTKPVQKLDDLAGLTAGAWSGWVLHVAEELGMSYTVVTAPDTYTALERGVIDIFFASYSTHEAFALGEVAKYVIDHPVYTSTLVILMNLDTWNNLPKHLQDLMYDVYWEQRAEQERLNREAQEQSRQKLIDMGVEMLHFTPDEAERFIEIAYGAEKARLIEQFPETAPRILELVSK